MICYFGVWISSANEIVLDRLCKSLRSADFRFNRKILHFEDFYSGVSFDVFKDFIIRCKNPNDRYVILSNKQINKFLRDEKEFK